MVAEVIHQVIRRAMATPFEALESAVKLNTGNLATFTIDVTRRIDNLENLVATAQTMIHEQNIKLQDRIETAFVQRDHHTSFRIEEVVKNAEQRVQQAVQHGEQRLQQAAQHLQQEAQQAAQQLQQEVKQNDARITTVCKVTEGEFVKQGGKANKHEHLLQDHEHRVQVLEVQISQLKDSIKTCENLAATFQNPNLLKSDGTPDPDARNALAHLGNTMSLLKANVKEIDN